MTDIHRLFEHCPHEEMVSEPHSSILQMSRSWVWYFVNKQEWAVVTTAT